ncbi:hypothetical protein EXU34_21740 [Alteromonas sp. ZYF713]|nr:hypothetical protein [Alteromonas sp. ZYF713]
MAKESYKFILVIFLYCTPLFSESSELLYTSSTEFKAINEQSLLPGTEQYTAINELKVLLENAQPPNPFTLEDDSKIDFDWCREPENNRTLRDLITKLENQSAFARDMAQLYLYTKNKDALAVSYDYIKSWTQNSTLINGYKLGMKPDKAWFPGIEKGFCNRSWNMMLDTIWQSYGLINFSQVYMILKAHPEALNLNSDNLNEIHNWLARELVPAVNAGFHAWTRWADANPKSKAYVRYRSDNHLSWVLAGLSAAAVALTDKDLFRYVVYGTEYDDGVSGPYFNPSNLLQLTSVSIDNSGKIFDQEERRSQHKGMFYANFNLWALTAAYVAIINSSFEIDSQSENKIRQKLYSALNYYSNYISKKTENPDAEEKSDETFFAFVYLLGKPIVCADSVYNSNFTAAALARNNQKIIQGIGHISLARLTNNTETWCN